MNVFIVDNTVNVNVLQSQLLTPLAMIEDQANIKILLPRQIKTSVDQFLLLKDSFVFYTDTKNKFHLLYKYGTKADHLYTRSVKEFITILILKNFFFKNTKLVYDFRGLAYAEYQLKNEFNFINSAKSSILKFMERLAFQRADIVLTVSNSFKNFLLAEFKKGTIHKVIPCCISKIDYLKEDLIMNKKPVSFVYLGSLSKWQKFEEVITLYKKISNHIPEAKLTVVTNEIEKAEFILQNNNITARITSLKHKEINAELSKHTFGFILRDNILLNNVASPIKFLEYLRAGVIPIYSKGIGDYSDLCDSSNVGILYDSNDLQSVINKIKSKIVYNGDVDKLLKIASNYTWDKYYKNYLFQNP